MPPGSVAVIGKNGSITNFDVPADSRVFMGVGGISALPLAIVKDLPNTISVCQDVWVSPSNGVRFTGKRHQPRWKVTAKGQTLGEFDRIIIAHNGKCADRLMSRTPAKKLHSLLQTNFSPTVPAWGGKRMTLNSIYSLTFAVKKDTLLSQKTSENVCYFVKNHRNLRFLSCNSRKHQPKISSDNEIWTVLSSPHFAKKYKAPQENLPEDIVANVTHILLRSVEESLSLPPDCIMPIESRLQLWGAALPLNTWTGCSPDNPEKDPPPGFVYDDDYGVGVCGDWLLDPSIEGAWESGRRLAEWMAKGGGTVGLPPNGAFKADEGVSSEGIGSLSAVPTKNSGPSMAAVNQR